MIAKEEELCSQLCLRVEDSILNPEVNTDLRTDVPYDFKSLNEENRDAKAKEGNLDIVFPKSNELQIDIDNEHSYQVFKNQIVILRKYISVTNIEEHESKGGLPGRHITVTLFKDVTMIERLALQAMLGSDRIRELLGYIRYDRKEPRPTCFFERKA